MNGKCELDYEFLNQHKEYFRLERSLEADVLTRNYHKRHLETVTFIRSLKLTKIKEIE